MTDKTFELLSLNDIFDSGRRQLAVPDYQRGYSWDEEQRRDLIGDIEQIQDQHHKHFTGTVVTSRQGQSTCYDIVDGQQRITSLVLLISAIVRLAHQRQLTELAGLNIANIESCFLYSGADSGSTRYQLNLGAVRDPLFREVLLYGRQQNHKIKSKADKNIIDAVEKFNCWLLTKSETELGHIAETVTTKLGFLLYSPTQDAELGLMFEVINNRGKPLSELEKVKNYLIYYADKNRKSDLKDKVNSSWPILLNSLNEADSTSIDDENSFLRVCWIVFKDCSKGNSYHVYESLKLNYPVTNNEHWLPLGVFIDFIVNCANTYAALYSAKRSKPLSGSEQSYLNRLSLHPAHASVLPLLVALYAKVHNTDQRIKLLDLLEKLNFRYYVTGIATRNDSGQGDLFRYAHEFYNEVYDWRVCADTVNDHFGFLEDRLVTFVSEQANDQKFVQYLTLDHDESGNYYAWRGLKFFLGSYEDSLLSENQQDSKLSSFLAKRDTAFRNDFYHLEHIWATADYTVVNDKNDPIVNKRRLGNFILLIETINIKVSNSRPEDKVELYFADNKLRPNTLMIRQLREDFEVAKQFMAENSDYQRKVAKYWCLLYEKFLDIRECRLVNFALDRWRVEGINKPVEWVDIDSGSGQNEIFKCFPQYKS